MNLELIQNHLNYHRWSKHHGLSWELPKTIPIENLNQIAEEFTNEELFGWMKTAPAPLQALLFGNIDLLRYLLPIMKEIPCYKLEKLLQQVDIPTLLGLSPNEVIHTLNDPNIPQPYWGIYLSLYVKDELTEEQKTMLWKGLKNYYGKMEDISSLKKHKKLFYTKLLASPLLLEISDFSSALQNLEENITYVTLLEFLAAYTSTSIDDDNNKELLLNCLLITSHFQDLIYSLQGHESAFLPMWLNNHNLLYDLKTLASKAKKGISLNFCTLSKDRISYISSIYSNTLLFSKPIENKEMEELIIYAIGHKKRAFLSLIQEHFELFHSLPNKSLIFNRYIYTNLININTLNHKNLEELKKLTFFNTKWTNFLTKPPYTFNEIALFSKNRTAPIYVKLYSALELPVDKKIIIIREIINKHCLPMDANVKTLADKLCIKPLSVWMQNDFGHIKDIDAALTIALLSFYEKVHHLIPEININAEVRYIVQNIEFASQVSSMKELRDNILTRNPEWLELKNEFNITDDFVQKYKTKILRFLLQDGAHIILTYMHQHCQKKEAIRRIVMAELMGRFSELKYYKDDLSKELDYPISKHQIKVWASNFKMEKGNLQIWEEDALLPVMQMGVIPHRTCLSYIDGQNNNCLLACHDANKKILYLTYDNKIVLRAAIRLTKGYLGTKKEQKEKLEFVDLEEQPKESSQKEKKAEYLTLFLERAYIAGLPENEKKKAIELVIELMEQKAKELNAHLVISESYTIDERKDIVRVPYSLYISKSKAGVQYLDSLGGSRSISDEGNYYFGRHYLLQY